MELHVGCHAVIGLKVKGRARDAVFIILVPPRCVEFPVLIVDRLWVVSTKRWASGEIRCANKAV